MLCEERVLIDHVNNLKLQYLVELSKLGDSCAGLERHLAEWLHDHDVVFGGSTIPFVLMPHFISPGQLRRVRHSVDRLSRVLDRFCDAYPHDAALRDELAVSPEEDSLIRIEPGYPRPMRICRLDAFLAGYAVKFLEFNADSPAGIGYTDILHEGLTTAIDLPRVKQDFDTAYTPMLPELIATLLEDLDQADLVAAARDGRVCIVNPFRARVANTKKLLALFQDPRFAHLVEGDEAEVVAKTIPWTRILRPGRVSYGSWTIDLLPFVADNRERLVLKPASSYGGHNVALGIETPQERWEEIIAAHAERADFVAQEYVPVPEEMFPTIEDGHVQMRLKRFNINPFGIGGRHAGSITRISDRAVINVSAGGGLLPSVIGRHKRRLLAEDEGEEEEVVHGS